ncbi:mitochondrial ribosomal protein l51 / s25 / CI-B8 domain-containing protein [Phthorimaea operculella]|nr:mitochondrial ribosomal protein l51 / s25 / CI-B8 domain-containing protein [Phthorimaea operculella]
MAVRLGGALKELRIHLCQTGASSKGVREFITQNYVNLKTANPQFPILIRECKGVQPRIWARFERGAERSVPLTNLSAADVANTLKQLVK